MSIEWLAQSQNNISMSVDKTSVNFYWTPGTFNIWLCVSIYFKAAYFLNTFIVLHVCNIYSPLEYKQLSILSTFIVIFIQQRTVLSDIMVWLYQLLLSSPLYFVAKGKQLERKMVQVIKEEDVDMDEEVWSHDILRILSP